MAVYVERDAVISWIEKQKRLSKLLTIMMIQETPAADVVPAVHARWCEKQEPLAWDDVAVVECSACGDSWIMGEMTFEDCVEFMRYCPHCGAKMDQED